MKKWYDKQSPRIRLAYSFLFNFIFWLLFELFMDWILAEQDGQKMVWYQVLAKAIIMAVFWTCFMSWPLIKTVFSGKKQRDGSTQQ
jgi:hypothetical protein